MKQRWMVFFQCSSLNTDIKLEQLVCITFPSASGLQTRTRMEGIDRSSAQTSCAAASRHFLNINSWFNLSKAEVRREEKLSPWRVCRCPPPRRCWPRGRGCGWGWRGCPAPDPRALSPGSSYPCSASSCSEISSPSRQPCPVCDPLKISEDTNLSLTYKPQWIHTWICKLLNPRLFGSNVHQRSSNIPLQLAQGTLGSLLLTTEVCHGAANVVTIKIIDIMIVMVLKHWHSRGIHFELYPDLQLSPVVCLALARFALQWIPPGDIDVVNKELSDT